MSHYCDESFNIGPNSLRVLVKDKWVCVFHNGKEVAATLGDLTRTTFQVIERGRLISYEVTVARSDLLKVFVHRDGALVFSADPA